MIRLVARGDSHVGMVRSNNQDSLLVMDSVFAVADGMGGHAGGEVASSLALEPLGTLDGRVYGTAEEARAALLEAVVQANEAVVSAAAADASLHGMGTTLTAALFEGRRLHIAHVGDSRGYLLRDDRVHQLTRDHTFVQQLIDDGAITEEEAAVHPQRSVVTRAIGVNEEIEVDLETLELRNGDVMLLCSDGLSGVVPDPTIEALLTSGRPPDEVVKALIGAANAAGGPDNITAVLLKVVTDRPAEEASPAGPQTLVIRPDADAASMRVLPGPGPDESIVKDPVAQRRRIASIIIALATVLGLTLGAGRWLLSRSFFVGLDGEAVVIYEGVPGSIGPFKPSWVAEETGLTVDDVPPFQLELLEQGIAATSQTDARTIVESMRKAATVEDDTPDGDPSPDTDDPDGTGSG